MEIKVPMYDQTSAWYRKQWWTWWRIGMGYMNQSYRKYTHRLVQKEKCQTEKAYAFLLKTIPLRTVIESRELK